MKRSPLARAPSPIVDFLMEVYDTNRRSLEGDAATAQQLCEVAGKNNGGMVTVTKPPTTMDGNILLMR